MRQLVRFYANHPLVGLLGTIASVVGVALSIYFYWISRRFPDITVAFEPGRARLVTAGLSSTLRVLSGDREITSDVTAVQVSIWNNGTNAVRAGDILEPIRLQAEPPVPILETRLIQVSRKITGFSLDISRQDEGALGVGFEILEPGDGASMQIIYAGKPEQRFSANGAFVGQRTVSTAWRPTAVQPESRPDRISFVLIAIVAAVAGVMLTLECLRTLAMPDPAHRAFEIGKLVLFGQAALFGFYIAFDALRNVARMARPPF